MPPDTCEAVGLQFEFDRKGVGLRLTCVLADFIDFGQDAEQVLDMVADFVRNYIGKSRFARCSQFLRISS